MDAVVRRALRAGDWSGALVAMGRLKKSWHSTGAAVLLARPWLPAWGPRPEPELLPISAIYPLRLGGGWHVLLSGHGGINPDSALIVGVSLEAADHAA